MNNDKTVFITEAAKINGVSRQAIYIAIKKRKLKAHKDKSHWEINLKDLEKYRKEKYSRNHSVFEGELIFDKNKGLNSVREVAKKLNVPTQKIYYSIRTGLIQAIQKRAAWVIHENDIKSYQENYINKKSDTSQVG